MKSNTKETIINKVNEYTENGVQFTLLKLTRDLGLSLTTVRKYWKELNIETDLFQKTPNRKSLVDKFKENILKLIENGEDINYRNIKISATVNSDKGARMLMKELKIPQKIKSERKKRKSSK